MMMLFFLLLLLLVFLGIPLYTVRAIHHSRKRTYSDSYFVTPWELRVPFECVAFPSTDGIVLRGWWLPRESANVIVGCSGRDGAKDDLIGIGTFLWRSGYSVLLFDCRDRGESAAARRSPGHFETRDLAGAVRLARTRAPNARIGIIGFSMGAAVAIETAAKNPDIAAVAADSSYAALGDLIAARFRRWHLPAGLLLRLTDACSQCIHGYRLTRLCPADAVPHIKPRPLLLIHGGADSLIPPTHARRIFKNAVGPKELWIAENADHCGAYFLDREAYCMRVQSFFDRAMSRERD
jgi:uncharacterized protein